MNEETFGRMIKSGDVNKEMQKTLEGLVNQTVSVWAGVSEARKDFDTAICVNGKLEQHGAQREKFRVVVTDGTYTYFTTSDVVRVINHPLTFKDGSRAVVKIAFNQVG